MFFQVRSFPKCDYHLFLSHSREDHASLVRPVYDGLAKSHVVSFLDVEDYPAGRDSRTALKGELLLSRHVVFFITEAMLASSRGWCILELAYSEILQSMMHFPGGQFCHFVLPLFFVEQSNIQLPRSVWQLLRDRGVFTPSGLSTADQSDWAVDQISRFLQKEQHYQNEMSLLAIEDAQWTRELRKTVGAYDRAVRFQPHSLKFPDSP
jgi:hypothetical protein